MLAKAREATVSQGKEGDEEVGDVEADDEEADIRINRSNNKSKKITRQSVLGRSIGMNRRYAMVGIRRNRWIRGIMNGYRCLRVVGR